MYIYTCMHIAHAQCARWRIAAGSEFWSSPRELCERTTRAQFAHFRLAAPWPPPTRNPYGARPENWGPVLRQSSAAVHFMSAASHARLPAGCQWAQPPTGPPPLSFNAHTQSHKQQRRRNRGLLARLRSSISARTEHARCQTLSLSRAHKLKPLKSRIQWDRKHLNFLPPTRKETAPPLL